MERGHARLIHFPESLNLLGFVWRLGEANVESQAEFPLSPESFTGDMLMVLSHKHSLFWVFFKSE